jgi:Zn finger protein HypA/HybF involved in hydrogenase expression
MILTGEQVVNISDSTISAADVDEEITLESIFAMHTTIDVNTIISNMNSALDIFNNDDVFEKKKIKEVEKIDYKQCPSCLIPCKIHETMLICESCGLERVWDCHSHNLYSMTINQDYNTSNSFLTFNIVGANSYCYNRSFLKTCADYTKFRDNSNRKAIVNMIYQYPGNKPPMNVVNSCADIFDQIKNKGYVYRGDGKLGVIAACLYYASIMNNLTRTPKEIAQIIGIDEKFLSNGDRILQELNELGVITIPTNYKPLDDYLDMYFPILEIPEKYKAFIKALIARAEKKHLHINNESRLTTKIIGCIYLLTRRVKELNHIKKETISLECGNISKSTFIRYYTLIVDNYKIMKKPFRKFRIPMESSWRD